MQCSEQDASHKHLVVHGITMCVVQLGVRVLLRENVERTIHWL